MAALPLYRINPAFDRFPTEAQLIGKLLAGFGEIEFSVCRNAGQASGIEMLSRVLKALYRLRATSSRIEVADALARPRFDAAGLGREYQTVQAMVGTCLRIRNQFAHCNWSDHLETPSAGLFFTDLQMSAEATEGFEHAWRHVDARLLKEHEAYFAITMDWLWFVHASLEFKLGREALAWPRPPEREPPAFHNPPEKHVPPWLTGDQKALHIARAQAAQGGAPTPTPAQQDLDRKREAKRARRQADRHRDTAKGSDPESQQCVAWAVHIYAANQLSQRDNCR